jgi:hypothetical protein
MIVCQKCEFENFVSYDLCEKCGQELTNKTSPPMDGYPLEINTYLTEAILTTVFFLSPIGIPAIIYAAKAKSKVETGDIEGAAEYSRKARNWYWLALGVGLTLVVLYMMNHFN